jgi:putative transposase
MPNYRRFFVPGASVFFTVVTHERRPILTSDCARRCLHQAILTVQGRYPFENCAFILLPDHLHAIWNLPRGDAAYSLRWRRIKEEFTLAYRAAGGTEGERSRSRRARQERGVWQRRFWDHVLRDETDLERHFDYIHYNAVKHGLVTRPADWPYSTFHRYVERGFYQLEWGSAPLSIAGLDETAME